MPLQNLKDSNLRRSMIEAIRDAASESTVIRSRSLRLAIYPRSTDWINSVTSTFFPRTLSARTGR